MSNYGNYDVISGNYFDSGLGWSNLHFDLPQNLLKNYSQPK